MTLHQSQLIEFNTDWDNQRSRNNPQFIPWAEVEMRGLYVTFVVMRCSSCHSPNGSHVNWTSLSEPCLDAVVLLSRDSNTRTLILPRLLMRHHQSHVWLVNSWLIKGIQCSMPSLEGYKWFSWWGITLHMLAYKEGKQLCCMLHSDCETEIQWELVCTCTSRPQCIWSLMIILGGIMPLITANNKSGQEFSLVAQACRDIIV